VSELCRIDRSLVGTETSLDERGIIMVGHPWVG
jgi:hypothetical protein